MKKWITAAGIVGLILALYGLISAIFYSSATWYDYFVIGGAFFLGYVNYKLKNESVLGLLEENKLRVFGNYALYAIAGIIIELVGRFLLHLWEYPSLNHAAETIRIFIIFYPFGFFFIYESFVLIKSKLQSFGLTVVVATLVNAFLHEIPNTFAWEWRYTIPYVTFEILRINIVVIVGWAILIAVSLLVKRILP